MNVLVINAGSSSLKYQLIDSKTEQVMSKGVVERIGTPEAVLKHEAAGKGKFEITGSAMDHTAAVKMVLTALTDKKHGVISDLNEISAVGHRIVHGGEKFSESVILTDDVVNAIRENIPLAPLHNPANIMGIEAIKANLPNVPMVCVFDTAFHQTMPKKAYMYGLPAEAYEEFKIRRYGFHGTSHKFVSERAADILKKDISELKLITCHLGNGSSIAAVKFGKVVDTSMGFTPLEGLPMGTRSGDIDPAIIPFLMGKLKVDINGVMNYLQKKSGVLGLSSGLSSDFRDLRSAAQGGNTYAQIAIEVFCYRVKKYIGSYAAIMNGVDAVIFTAGIGENDYTIRERCVEELEFFGIKLDKELNATAKGEKIVSTADSKVKVMSIPTNEELMIARDTVRLLSK